MVSPGVPTEEFQMLALRAQREANNRQVIFRAMGPGPDRTPSQPDIVRKAVADGASALIVMPGDSPELGKALAEAEAKGVPVIMLARTIPAPDGSKPFTVVEHGDFDKSAKQIVEATLEDANKVGRSTEGTALVMVDQATDSSSTRRVAALKAAAEAAGFRKVVMVPYEPVNDDSAKVALLEAVKANPDVSIVLGDDSDSTMWASEVRMELQAKPAFFVGGYMKYGVSKAYLAPTKESCFVEGTFIELGALAVKTALARLRGEPVQEHTVLPSKFTRGQGLVATAVDLMKKKPMLEGGRTLGEVETPGGPPPPEPKP
jgi:ABC-type sugar transport system substrate-binding protein